MRKPLLKVVERGVEESYTEGVRGGKKSNEAARLDQDFFRGRAR